MRIIRCYKNFVVASADKIETFQDFEFHLAGFQFSISKSFANIIFDLVFFFVSECERLQIEKMYGSKRI